MRKILLVLCLLLILGCEKTPNQQKDVEAQIRLREKILNFAATHSASIEWLKELPKWEENAFTAHFQIIFLDRQEISLLPLEIADLVRKENHYMLVANMSHAIFTPYEIKIILKCPAEIAKKILDSEMENTLDTFLFAAKVNKVRNARLELIPELNYSPEEVYINSESADIYTDVNFIESHVILVGECIALENIGDSYFDYEKLTSGFSEWQKENQRIKASGGFSDLSETTTLIDANDSDVTERIPQIEASYIWGNGESFISVGGKLIREGDIINGFRFLKAYPDKVEFEKNGKIVAGIIQDTQTYTSPTSNSLLRQPFSSEQSRYNNYSKQYRQPTYSNPSIAENGSYYGQISKNTGRPKTVYVRGYYRKDGTYVRSHYRSPPSK